jgi:hypothetical protein
MEIVASDLDMAIMQLESWVENQTSVRLVFAPCAGLAISLIEDGLVGLDGLFAGLDKPGTLERFEGHYHFRNSTAAVNFDPPASGSEVLFEDRVYQLRLQYAAGLLTIYECRGQPGGADGVDED